MVAVLFSFLLQVLQDMPNGWGIRSRCPLHPENYTLKGGVPLLSLLRNRAEWWVITAPYCLLLLFFLSKKKKKQKTEKTKKKKHKN